jgi:hypothetical protein
VKTVQRVMWGWVNHDGSPQDETFPTAEAALDEMQRRLGERDITLERLAGLGFKLARVRVSFEVVSMLEPVA